MTRIEAQDQYPSTSDMPPIMGAQDDPVLLILERAYKRYRWKATRSGYQESTGSVCAVGAVGAADGFKPRDINAANMSYDEYFELMASESAKTAIELLNRSASKLYPDTSGYEYEHFGWSGPLEHINQELPWDEAKKAVKAIYEDAIEKRKGLVAV